MRNGLWKLLRETKPKRRMWQVAEDLGMNYSRLCQIANGKIIPNSYELIKLKMYFDVSEQEITSPLFY